ncbi:MAG TPA: hypothetical protein PLP42_18235 [Acidobacteriota bacterium]|nr:hypothetical protein [Acidobacteriota bacterium]
MRLKLWFVIPIPLFMVMTSAAKDITKQSGKVLVNVVDADAEMGRPRVDIGGQPTAIELNNGTDVVDDIPFIGPSRIVVRGKRSRQYSRTNVITVIDPRLNRVIDTIWGLDAAFSPDSSMVAYQFMGPWTTPGVVLWPALIAYDLTAPPEFNNAAGAGSPFAQAAADPARPFAERGVILYPEKHRITSSYFILLEKDDGEMSGGRPRLGFVSPIAWSPDSKRVAVVDHDAGQNRLVVIDISRGLHQPSVVLVPIAREAFLQAGFGNALPDEYADFFVVFQELDFTDDGGSVVLKSWRSSSYAEKTVSLPVPKTP